MEDEVGGLYPKDSPHQAARGQCLKTSSVSCWRMSGQCCFFAVCQCVCVCVCMSVSVSVSVGVWVVGCAAGFCSAPKGNQTWRSSEGADTYLPGQRRHVWVGLAFQNALVCFCTFGNQSHLTAAKYAFQTLTLCLHDISLCS